MEHDREDEVGGPEEGNLPEPGETDSEPRFWQLEDAPPPIRRVAEWRRGNGRVAYIPALIYDHTGVPEWARAGVFAPYVEDVFIDQLEYDGIEYSGGLIIEAEPPPNAAPPRNIDEERGEFDL